MLMLPDVVEINTSAPAARAASTTFRVPPTLTDSQKPLDSSLWRSEGTMTAAVWKTVRGK